MSGKRCPHGWTVLLPDFTCPRSSCPANVPPSMPAPAHEKTYAHCFRFRDQVPTATWSEWHRLTKAGDDGVRGGRCGVRVRVGIHTSIERGARPDAPAEDHCARGCFA